jgi:SAM-dependent methyltransferase/tetratricopeptide (TPR) repeat protein
MPSRPRRPSTAIGQLPSGSPQSGTVPSHASIVAMRAAIAAHRAGQLEEAIGHYRQAVRHTSHFPQGHYNLGLALKAAGKVKAAEAALTEALRLDPRYGRAHAGLAALYAARGTSAKALRHWINAYRLLPNEPDIINSLVAALGKMRFDQADERLPALVTELLLRPDVEVQRLAGPALSLLALDPRIKQALQSSNAAHLPTTDPPALLLATLKRIIIADPTWETLLTQARNELVESFQSLDDPRAVFSQALADQMLATEYAYAELGLESPDTQPPPQTLELSAAHLRFALCAPLASVAEQLEAPDGWTTFCTTHVDYPRQEREAAAAITSLSPIEDETSLAVRDQYMALPYPRWLSTRGIVAQPRHGVMRAALPGMQPLSAPDPKPLRVLVAGCGTGKHAIDVATRFADAEVLAIDLSRTTLGYAIAQAGRLGIANVRFAEADILALGTLSERFDHIEAMGVLHHLHEPAAGWRVLCGLLAPGGTMRIGLYSRQGRVSIQAAQAIAATFGHDAEGLRALRQAIRQLAPGHPAAGVTRELDFYSLSGVRDALAHAQEHDYTLPEIAALLEELSLEFLGFEFATPQAHQRYAEAFPDDPTAADLTCWDRLERQHPDLFHHMYQFWCRPLG